MASSFSSNLTQLLWLLLLPCAISQTYHNITLGSFLSTDQENTSKWVSPSGEFAFGFYPLSPDDRFLLAIWFDKIPQKTVVWFADVEKQVQTGSKLKLTDDGWLVLYDHQEKEIWRPDSGNTSAASAALLDFGNFELRSSNSSVIWGSFDEPSDTILPTQKLSPGSSLYSRRTETEYSRGKFQLNLEENQGLVLVYANIETGNTLSRNYLRNGSELEFDAAGYIYLVQSNGSILNLTSPRDLSSMNEFYHRATLDVDGVLRQYIYPKNLPTLSEWSIVGFFPLDICIAVVASGGGGVCGYNSYCILEDNRPTCKCPHGYSLVDPNKTWEGCKQDFELQNCYSEGLGAEEQFEFQLKEMANADWVLFDFEYYNSIEENLCTQYCLDDCFCAVAIYRDKKCWKKRLPLSNGRMNPSIGGKAFIKVLNSSRPLNDSCKRKKDQLRLVYIGSTLLGSSVFLNLLLVSAISFAIFNSYHKKLLRIFRGSSLTAFNLHSFTFKEIEAATNGFKEELGRGAFGTVYKGALVSNSTNLVAVKRLEKVIEEGEREFKTEVSVIGQSHHRNLVRLLGFCDEGPHRLLVYEFMSNGTLASFLFGKTKPDWNRRMQIAIGIARGLTYLHEECGTHIIHCDIKPQNILLDDWLVARISDFGLAKLLKTDEARTTTGVRGTRGYLAPEWFRNLPVTVKVDVYSFGIMLMEIICCRTHIEMEVGHEDEVILRDWMYKCYREGRLDLLVERDEETMIDKKMLERVVMVAIWCAQEDPSLRPSMKKVTRMMLGVVDVPVPMDLSSY